MAQDKNGRLGRESKAYVTIRMQAGHSAARPRQRVKAQSSGDSCVLAAGKAGETMGLACAYQDERQQGGAGRTPFRGQ